MKKYISLLFLLLAFALNVNAQSIDGKTVKGLPEKTSVDTNDVVIIADYPTWKWHKTQRKNLVPDFTESTYTPTAASVTNVATTVPSVSYYQRFGYTVNVFGQVNIDPTAQVISESTLTLPVASDFTNAADLAGMAIDSVGTTYKISAHVSGDKASIKFVATDTTAKKFSYHFTYKIK